MLMKFIGLMIYKIIETMFKRAVKNLNNTINRYYSNKDSIKFKIENEEKNIEKWASHKIILSYDLYPS